MLSPSKICHCTLTYSIHTFYDLRIHFDTPCVNASQMTSCFDISRGEQGQAQSVNSRDSAAGVWWMHRLTWIDGTCSYLRLHNCFIHMPRFIGRPPWKEQIHTPTPDTHIQTHSHTHMPPCSQNLSRYWHSGQWTILTWLKSILISE